MLTSEPDRVAIHELTSFLDGLEVLAPTRTASGGNIVSYRAIELDGIVDDTLQTEEEIQYDASSATITENELPEVCDFRTVPHAPVVAVDCGVVRLGETENGVVIALRATIVVDKADDPQIYTFRTGPLYLHNHHQLELFHRMGKQLGKANHFVEIDNSDPTNPQPVRVKSGVGSNSHYYSDRIRNWFERLVQKIAVSQIENGIVLIDGAFTLRTIDTPDIFFERLAALGSERGNSVVALSKQSLLQVKGKPIRFWLSDYPERPCYRSLTSLMRREDIERVFGNTYAVRFSHLGPTFRMDVKPTSGQSDSEAIDRMFSSVLLRGGYPDILVRAHAYSYFTAPDVIQLQAHASSKYNLIPQADVDLSAIFGPFGGRFK